MVIEIYPAVLVGKIKKSHPARLAERVRDDDRIPTEWKAHAACSQDAFDAAMSALRMADHVDELRELAPAEAGSPEAREGQIWLPPTSDR